MIDILAIIAIITSIGGLVVIFGKTIKKSSCLGSNCESRSQNNSILEHNIDNKLDNIIDEIKQTSPKSIKKEIINEIEV